MIDGKPIFTEAMLTSAKPLNTQLREIGAQLHARDFYQDYGYEIQWSNKFALEGIALYDKGDYLIDQFLGVAFNKDEQKVYDKHWPSIRDYMLERQQAWVLGTGDVEKDWDGYMSQINKMGYEKVIAAMQSAYARQYGK